MNYGCKYQLPHDLKVEKETKSIICEVCILCTKKFRWIKGFGGRVNNKEYLITHKRNFCQRREKRLFNKIYHPEKMVIKL